MQRKHGVHHVSETLCETSFTFCNIEEEIHLKIPRETCLIIPSLTRKMNGFSRVDIRSSCRKSGVVLRVPKMPPSGQYNATNLRCIVLKLCEMFDGVMDGS